MNEKNLIKEAQALLVLVERIIDEPNEDRAQQLIQEFKSAAKAARQRVQHKNKTK